MKNFRYVEKTSAECNEDSYLAILHLSRVQLHCKLQEKLHRVTWPLVANPMKGLRLKRRSSPCIFQVVLSIRAFIYTKGYLT